MKNFLHYIQSLFSFALQANEEPAKALSQSLLMKRVRQIEIKTRGLSNHIFGGEYHTAFKGRGMSFSEVREYYYGDDVRNIDWNVTARFRSPYVKVFEEERELTLMLLVDISASSLFGTRTMNKRELMTELCATLAFSAMSNNDKVGVLFFSDKIERYIPPKKGKTHILFIIRELLALKPHQNAQTDIAAALKYVNNVLKKRAITFLLSDFRSAEYQDALRIVARHHDLVGVHVYDHADATLPDIGVVALQDSETNNRY
jgi:Uncharacterized conserved protein (some members contain a von Willebrand factor type A (vWA) domain)